MAGDTRPAVLLLHGQPGGRGDWDAVRAAVGAEVRVLAPDRPGYGSARGPARGIFANADAAEELLEAEGVEEVVVAGHSWGGGVALALAAERPELVRGLVLAASIGPRSSVDRFDRVLTVTGVGPALSAGLLLGGSALLRLDGFRDRSALPAAARRRVAAELRDRRSRRAFTVEQRALVREIGALDALLGEVRAPTRVLTGGRDHLLSPAVSAELAARLPNARLDTVEGAGHVLPDEAPEAIASAIFELLTGPG